MDNREAFKEWYLTNYGRDIFNPESDDGYSEYLIAEQAWQAATAHNTDAVIDKCIEAVEGCELVEGTNFKRIRLHQAIGSLLGLKRSLKTNKEG